MITFLSDLYSYFLLFLENYSKEITITSVLGILIGGIKQTYNKIKNFKNNKKLSFYFEHNIVSIAQKNYIKTKCQNIDPSDEINLKSSFAFAAKEDLLKFFLKKVFKSSHLENKYYLLLADSGMGKTTFMVNLFVTYNSFLNELFNKPKITLLPIGIGFNELSSCIEKIDNKENHIILLDGFDELPESNADNIEEYFDKLINISKDFKTVIITCRTHYFSSEKEEPNELKVKKFNTKGNGFYSIKKMYISPFDHKDIKSYINKTFSFFQIDKKKRAYQIVENTDDLLFRPMLLSHINELIEYKNERIIFKVDIYQVLILSWLERESFRYPENERFEFKKKLAFFSYELTKHVYSNFEENGLYINLNDVEKLAYEFNIDLNKIELKSRSLLNRISKGFYKFSHKSIFEFLLAYLSYISRWQHLGNIQVEYNVHGFDQTLAFFEEMVLSGKTTFQLPNTDEKSLDTNSQLIRNIMFEEKNNKINFNSKINWVDDFNYKIIR